jgi:hypothetical protein
MNMRFAASPKRINAHLGMKSPYERRVLGISAGQNECQ